MSSSITSYYLGGVNHEGWLAMRKRGLGGTDVSAVAGKNPFRTEVDVWLDKTGRSGPQPDNIRMWRGRMLEPAVADWYAEATGRSVRKHNYMLHDQANCMIGNLDRLVCPMTEQGKVMMPAHKSEIRTAVGLEVKTTDLPPWDEVPDYVQAQVMTYMALAPSIERFDVALAAFGFGGGHFIYKVHRDNSMIDDLREMSRLWWIEHILQDTPPSPTNETDAKSLWPFSKGKVVVQVTEEMFDRLSLLREAEDAVKAAEARRSELRTAVMADMGEAEAIVDETGNELVTWKSAKPREIVNSKAIFAEANVPLSIIEKHTSEGAPSRRFLLKRKELS